jgi:hypothetical protein
MLSIKKIFLFCFVNLTAVVLAVETSAQDIDLFKMQDAQDQKEAKEKTDIVTATFKTTRLINGQSIENVGRGILDVKISHRFGTLNSGAYNLFGLDNASMRIGVDYGITDRLMVGVGRSTYEKQFDGFLKYRILRQSTGRKYMPISVSYAASVMLRTLDDPSSTVQKWYTDRLSFSHQLIIASKLNDYTSIQLMPTLVHYNSVPLAINPNDLYSLGLGFRERISKRVNLTGEYYYQINKLDGYYNSLSLGVDIETGGHVFQFHVSNSTGMTERTFINETAGTWGNGDIHFGFNIARVFTIKKKKDIKL